MRYAFIVFFFAIGLLVLCHPSYCNKDEWWTQLMAKAAARNSQQWISKSAVPIIINHPLKPSTNTEESVRPSASTTQSFIRRSGLSISDSPFQSEFETENPSSERAKNWDNSFSKVTRKSYKRTWSNVEPVRERYTETQWDDDVPVKEIFSDSWNNGDKESGVSAVDPGENTAWNGKEQYDRTNTGISGSRQSFKDDLKDKAQVVARPKKNNAYTIMWNTNNNNNPNRNGNSNDNNNDKQEPPARQAQVTRWDSRFSLPSKDDGNINSQPKAEIVDISNDDDNYDHDDTEKEKFNDGMNKWSKLMKDTFNNDNNDKPVTMNARQNFKDFDIDNNGDFADHESTPKTPKRLNWEPITTSSVKPKSKPSSNSFFSAKLKEDRKQEIGTPTPDKQTTAAARQKLTTFGWKMAINHATGTQTQPPTATRIASSTRKSFNSNLRNKPTVTTTFRTTTLKQDRTFIPTTTVKPKVIYTTTFGTRSNPKSNQKAKTIINLSNSISHANKNNLNDEVNNKQKQHRIGNWVDNDQLGGSRDNQNNNYNNNNNNNNNAVWRDSFKSLPLIEDEYDDQNDQDDDGDSPIEQLPERNAAPVQSLPAPQPQISIPRAAIQKEKSNIDYDDPSNWRIEDSIPGTPGTDYPVYASVPQTAFDCKKQEWPGYYADVETQCQVFHICQQGGKQDSFLCPNGTIFNQQVFVCDWWHNVQCSDSTDSYRLNADIYDYSFEKKHKSSGAQQVQSVKRSGLEEEIRKDAGVTRAEAAITSTTSKPPIEREEVENDDGDEEEEEDTDSSSVRKRGVESGKIYFDDDNGSSNNDGFIVDKVTRLNTKSLPIVRYKSAKQSLTAQTKFNSQRFKRDHGYLISSPKKG